jgi:MerR family copper efflux transcriptional regulator
MQIGELSKKSGFTRDTIRFYEKNGLIELEKDSRFENNYKDYSDKVLRRLEVIRRIKDYGFTLVEIKAMIELHELGLLEQERGRKYVERKLVRVQKKIDELEQIKKTLTSLINEPIESCTLKQILTELD